MRRILAAGKSRSTHKAAAATRPLSFQTIVALHRLCHMPLSTGPACPWAGEATKMPKLASGPANALTDLVKEDDRRLARAGKHMQHRVAEPAITLLGSRES